MTIKFGCADAAILGFKVVDQHHGRCESYQKSMSDVECDNLEATIGLKGVKKGRRPGWDEMPAEMVDVAGEIGDRWTKRLLNTCMQQCKVPEDWRTWLIVPIWKRKVDAQDPGK